MELLHLSTRQLVPWLTVARLALGLDLWIASDFLWLVSIHNDLLQFLELLRWAVLAQGGRCLVGFLVLLDSDFVRAVRLQLCLAEVHLEVRLQAVEGRHSFLAIGESYEKGSDDALDRDLVEQRNGSWNKVDWRPVSWIEYLMLMMLLFLRVLRVSDALGLG